MEIRAAYPRRLAPLAVCLAVALSLPAGAAASPTLGNWDLSAQRQVVRADLMTNLSPNNFAGGQRLTGTQVNGALGELAKLMARTASFGETSVSAASTTQPTVTVVSFDRLLVDQLGLAAAAAHVQSVTAAAGLQPPPYFGTEVVARFMGLRYTQPVGREQFALFPTDQITRAEAAWSLAQVLDTDSWNVQSARQTLSGYELPVMTSDQLTVLRIEVSRIGYPYIYAGTTDNTADGLPHGGFDCSGFVWRVYKVSGLPWGQKIKGRTAAQMAGEIPRSQRLHYSQLQPGDLLFFGTAHFNSPATEANVIHAGLYLGDNWVIHSSGQGVYVLPLEGSWLGQQFAWGRRVLP